MNNYIRYALKYRWRLFEDTINLPYDNLPYIGHLVTRNAITKGYCPKRANLKGNTLQEWSRFFSSESESRAPNRWACLSAVDLLVEHGATPDGDGPEDVEYWAGLLCYWSIAHGPFETVRQTVESVPEKFLPAEKREWLIKQIEALPT